MKYLLCLAVGAVLASSGAALAEDKKDCSGDDCITNPSHRPGAGTGIDAKGAVPTDAKEKPSKEKSSETSRSVR
jgi:hypothetical protein